MARYRDIDPSVMKLWDESKVNRNRKGQFWFKSSSKEDRLKEVLDWYSTEKVSDERLLEVAELVGMVERMGPRFMLPEGKDTVIPEMATIGVQDVWARDIPLPPALVSKNFVVPETVGWVAEYEGGKRRVGFNAANPYWLDPVGGAVKQYQQGWWSSDNPAGPVHHELGHHAHNMKYDSPYEWYEEASKPVPESIAGLVGERVSVYGIEEVGEFIAETFTGMLNGETYPPEIMEVYDYYNGPRLPLKGSD